MKEPAMGWKKRAEELANENAELVKKLAESDNAPLDIAMAVAGANARIAELEAENARLRSGGCARDQRTTQFCAEAVSLQAELARLRPLAELYPLAWEECKDWRMVAGTNLDELNRAGWYHWDGIERVRVAPADAHDQARAKAGVGQ